MLCLKDADHCLKDADICLTDADICVKDAGAMFLLFLYEEASTHVVHTTLISTLKCALTNQTCRRLDNRHIDAF
jgi:transcriptional regulator